MPANANAANARNAACAGEPPLRARRQTGGRVPLAGRARRPGPRCRWSANSARMRRRRHGGNACPAQLVISLKSVQVSHASTASMVSRERGASARRLAAQFFFPALGDAVDAPAPARCRSTTRSSAARRPRAGAVPDRPCPPATRGLPRCVP